jgi:gamma-glutamylaminecyclotransferase
MALDIRCTVFVYGSLMGGLHNHRLLVAARPLGPARTAPRTFRLLDLGEFPALVAARPGGREGLPPVRGELYGVDRDTLDRLDRLEGHPNLYLRATVMVYPETPGAPCRVQGYVMPPGRAWGDPPIVPGGDWRAYLEARAAGAR